MTVSITLSMHTSSHQPGLFPRTRFFSLQATLTGRFYHFIPYHAGPNTTLVHTEPHASSLIALASVPCTSTGDPYVTNWALPKNVLLLSMNKASAACYQSAQCVTVDTVWPLGIQHLQGNNTAPLSFSLEALLSGSYSQSIHYTFTHRSSLFLCKCNCRKGPICVEYVSLMLDRLCLEEEHCGYHHSQQRSTEHICEVMLICMAAHKHSVLRISF